MRITKKIVPRAVKKRFKQLISPLGPTTHRPAIHFLTDSGSVREWQQILMYAEVVNQIRDIPGDIFEFGVASGTSFKCFVRMAEAVSKYSHKLTPRKVVGFDTFAGLPPLTTADQASEGHPQPADMVSGGFNAAAQYGELNEFCKKHENSRLSKGLFSEALEEYFKNNEHSAVALAHIDCDLYTSTKDALEPVIRRIPPGGIILFDEIFHPHFPGETKAFWEIAESDKFDLLFEFVRIDAMPWKWYLKRK